MTSLLTPRSIYIFFKFVKDHKGFLMKIELGEDNGDEFNMRAYGLILKEKFLRA